MHAHCTQCQVVGVILGYSCRSLSAQNCNSQSFLNKNSSTGAGFHAFVRFMESSPDVQWALLENVRGMMQTRRKFNNEQPMTIQTERMAELGFTSCLSVLVNSCDFGLNQSRTRAWVLYIRTPYMLQLELK